MLLILVGAARPASADPVPYQFDITTDYVGGDSDHFGNAGSPDSGRVTITNNGASTFTGTLGAVGASNGGYAININVTIPETAPDGAAISLRPGDSIVMVMGNESSNQGGFNGSNGVKLFLNGAVTGASGASQSINLSVYDKDIHSGVFRTNPFGVSLDNYVLEGGDATRDTGDGYEETQSPGHYTFAQYGQDLGLQIGTADVNTWVGATSLFTINIKNIGVTAQTLTSAGITGTTWATLVSTLPVDPLQPGDETQLTFQLVVPAGETGGAAGAPRVIPVAAKVHGAADYIQNFNINLTQNPVNTIQATVVDDGTSAPIANALVALDDNTGLAYTNSSGQVTLNVNTGARTVFAYATGHLPNQQTLIVTPGSNSSVTLRLGAGQALQVSQVTATQLTAQQIAARGINLKDPNNFFVFDFVVKMKIGDLTVPSVVVPAHPAPGAIVSGSFGGGGGGGFAGSYTFYYPTGDPTVRVDTWIIIPGDIRVLKQFWDATVFINNNSILPIKGLTASLMTPDGLSLPALFNSPQPTSVSLGDLAPNSMTQAHWVVRGDKAGVYQLTGTAAGNLQLGGAAIPLVSTLQSSEITVVVPKLKVEFQTPTYVQAGLDFTLGVDITNESPIDLQDVLVDIDTTRLVNCLLDDAVTKDLGLIAQGAKKHVDFQFKSLVTGYVLEVQTYVSPSPVITPPVTVNAAPVNAAPDTATTTAGLPITISVLANDTAATALSVSGLTDPVDGSAVTDGVTVTYTPDLGFSGIDVFTYTATDTNGNSDVGRVTVTVNAPTPAIASLSPGSASVGATGFTLDVNGTGFVLNSQVTWNGVPLTTFFLTPTHLQAQVTPAQLTSGGLAGVTVANPAPGGGSASASITINNPVPVLSGLSPSSVNAGGGSAAVTLTGSKFVPGSQVQYNGVNLATTYVSSTKMIAVVPASTTAAAGQGAVTVFNPAPAGGSSGSQTFTVVGAPHLVISSVTATRQSDGSVEVNYTLSNNGSATAPAVKVTLARLTGTNGASVSASNGPADLAPGANLTGQAIFPKSVTAGARTFVLYGTLNGASYSVSHSVTTP